MTTRVRTARLAAPLAAALLVVFAGCGDDGGDDESTARPHDRVAFAQRANGLCAEASADRRTILSSLTVERGPEAAEPLQRIVDVDRQLVEDLDELEPSEADAADIDTMLERFRERLALEEEARTATIDADEVRLAELQAQLATVDDVADEIAGRFLMNECTRGRA